MPKTKRTRSANNDDAQADHKRVCASDSASNNEEPKVEDRPYVYVPISERKESSMLALKSTLDFSVPYTKDTAAAVACLPGSLMRIPACYVDSMVAILKLCCVAPNLIHLAECDPDIAEYKTKLEELGLWDLLITTCSTLAKDMDLELREDFTSELEPFEAYLPTSGELYEAHREDLVDDMRRMTMAARACKQFYDNETSDSKQDNKDLARSVTDRLNVCILMKDTDIWRHLVVAMVWYKQDVFAGLHKILTTLIEGHPKCTKRLIDCTRIVGIQIPRVRPQVRIKLVGSLLWELEAVARFERPPCAYNFDMVLYPADPCGDLYYIPHCLYYVYNLETRCVGTMPELPRSHREYVTNSFKSMAAYAVKHEAKSCVPDYNVLYNPPGEGPSCKVYDSYIIPKYVKPYGKPDRKDDTKEYYEVDKLEWERKQNYGFKDWRYVLPQNQLLTTTL